MTSCQKNDFLDKKANSENASSRTIPSSFPTTQNGILKFVDDDQLEEYENYLDAVRLNFDYSLYPNFCGDKALDLEEAARGYISMRKTLMDLGCNDEEAYNSHVFRDLGPFASKMVNQYGEVWIGNNIFKFFDNCHYIQVENNDLPTLLDVRTNGLKIADNIKWHDAITDIITPISPTEACSFELFQKGSDYDPNDPTKQNVYYYFKFFKENGKEDPNATFNGYIDWGDGTGTTINKKVNILFVHQYNLPSNASAQNILVTFSGSLYFCSCNCSPNLIYDGSVVVTTQSTLCEFTKHAATYEISKLNYTFNGNPNSIELWGYYNLNGDYLDGYRGRVDLTARHFTNGKLSIPGLNMTLNSSSGSLYRDNCSFSEPAFTPSLTGNNPEFSMSRRRGKHASWNKNYTDNINCNLICNESSSLQVSMLNKLFWK